MFRQKAGQAPGSKSSRLSCFFVLIEPGKQDESYSAPVLIFPDFNPHFTPGCTAVSADDHPVIIKY
jgi:hypothetical protein